MKDKTFLTAKEACEFLGTNRNGLYHLTHHKRINYYKPGGRKIYFKLSDLEQYIESSLVMSNDEIEQKATNEICKQKRQS